MFTTTPLGPLGVKLWFCFLEYTIIAAPEQIVRQRLQSWKSVDLESQDTLLVFVPVLIVGGLISTLRVETQRGLLDSGSASHRACRLVILSASPAAPSILSTASVGTFYLNCKREELQIKTGTVLVRQCAKPD